MLTLDTIANKLFKVIPITAESDLLKVVKVGNEFYLKCPTTRFNAKAFWDGAEKFSYTFIVGKNMHVGSIAFADIFFIDFNNQDFKILKPQEYAAAKK